MTTKTAFPNRIHKILELFLLINIIGEVGNVIAWWVVPSMQISLNGGEINGVTSPASLLSTRVGSQSALIIGSVLLLAIAALYAFSLMGLFKMKKQAPITIMGVSIANRVIALLIFAISVAFAFWAVWTIILVAVAYLDWRKMKTATAPV